MVCPILHLIHKRIQVIGLQNHLPGRQDHGIVNRLHCALGGGGEASHGIHGVAVQLDSQRIWIKGTEDVENPSSHTEISGFFHKHGWGIPTGDELADQPIPFNILTGQDQFRIVEYLLFRDQFLQQHLCREDHNGRGLIGHNPVKGADPSCRGLIVIGEELKWQNVIGGE